MIRPTVLETAAWGVGESVLHGKGLFAAREIPQGRPILAEARVLEHLAAAEGVNLTTAHNRFFDDLRNLNQADRSFVKAILVRHVRYLKGVTEVKLDEESATPQSESKVLSYISRAKSISEDQLDQVFSDPSCAVAESLLIAFFSVCFPFVHDEPALSHRLFRYIRRLNHACRPNAEIAWNDKTKRMTLHATQGIKPGEEIVISYIDHYNVCSKRHEALGFVCHCEACTESEIGIAVEDAARAKLGYSLAKISKWRAQLSLDRPFEQTAVPAILKAVWDSDSF